MILEQQKAMMDAILAQLQLLSKNHPQGGQNNTYKCPSRSKNKDKENDSFKDEEEDTRSHKIKEIIKDKILKDIQTKLDALTYKDTLQKARVMRPYPPNLDLVPFFETYRVSNIDK